MNRKYYSIKLTDKTTNYILLVSDIWSTTLEEAQKKLQDKIIDIVNDKNMLHYTIEIENISIFENL